MPAREARQTNRYRSRPSHVIAHVHAPTPSHASIIAYHDSTAVSQNAIIAHTHAHTCHTKAKHMHTHAQTHANTHMPHTHAHTQAQEASRHHSMSSSHCCIIACHHRRASYITSLWGHLRGVLGDDIPGVPQERKM